MDDGEGSGGGAGSGDGPAGDGWITTAEIVLVLDLSHSAAITALRIAGVEEVKVNGRGSGRSGKYRCLWRRDQVEALAKEREHVAWLKANGFKLCFGCGEWKDRARHFAPSGHRCRECMRKVAKAAWAASKQQRNRSTFGNRNPERLSGSVESYVGQTRPAEPKDALRYACMDVGYHHRPIPRGQSKREAYCTRCTAKRCMHHRDLTPKELVRRWKMSRGRMAAGMS